MKKQAGFTILEVFISFSLFAVFATVFLQNQSQNVFDSMQMNDELTLKHLCEGKMNETLVNLPEFTQSHDGKKESKKFEDDYADYQYTIEYKKFMAPDIASLMQPAADQEVSESEKQQLAMLKTVFNKVKEKIEQVFWQIRISVEKTQDGRYFELSTWIIDPKAKFDLEIPLLSSGGGGSGNGGDGQDQQGRNSP